MYTNSGSVLGLLLEDFGTNKHSPMPKLRRIRVSCLLMAVPYTDYIDENVRRSTAYQEGKTIAIISNNQR
jgi:hypothetical protein